MYAATSICYVDGSIFDAIRSGKFDAVIVFVPDGLTALRCDTKRFVQALGDVCLECDGLFSRYCYGENTSVWVCMKPIKTLDEMRLLVSDLCNALEEHGSRNVAMNGIRVVNLPEPKMYQDHSCERLLVEEVGKWCGVAKRPFDSVAFYDLRGGFNKVECPCNNPL